MAQINSNNVQNSQNGLFKTSSDTYEFIPQNREEFEDANHEAKLLLMRAQQTKPQDIDYTPIDPAKSYQFFEVLGAQTEKGARKTVYRASVVPRDELSNVLEHSAHETPMQKFKRLQFEVSQFVQEMDLLAKKEKDSFLAKGAKELGVDGEAKFLADTLNKVTQNENLSIFLQSDNVAATINSLHQEKLSNLLKHAIDQVKESKSLDSIGENNKTECQNTKRSNDISSEKLTQYFHMESRLNYLESLIGIHTPPTKNIVNLEATLSLLEKKVNLVDDQMIKSLTQRIRNLNHEFDALANKSAGINTGENVERIDKLLHKVEKWDSIANQVPLIVSRLQSLKDVHEESLLFGETIRRLTDHQNEITSLLNSQDSILESMEKGFADNMKTIEANVASIDNRMKNLQEKMQQLSS